MRPSCYDFAAAAIPMLFRGLAKPALEVSCANLLVLPSAPSISPRQQGAVPKSDLKLFTRR